MKPRMLLVSGAVLALVAGSLTWWRVASNSATPAPLPVPEELQPLMETAAPPDPFSDELEPVLAAVAPRYRAVLLRQHGRGDIGLETMHFKARAWALSVKNMTGADEEVEPFLEYLERPIPETVPLDSLLTPAFEEEVERRESALFALTKALLSTTPYSEGIRARIRTQALAHLPYMLWKEYAARLLVLLEEQGMLTPEQVALKDAAIEDAYLNRGAGFWPRFHASRSRIESGAAE